MTQKYGSRIKEIITMRAGDLLANADNWRVHPLFQKQALGGLLETVGKVDVLKAYHSPRYGGLTLVDGHLRQEYDPDEEWPVAILDISDDEADIILAHLDSITTQAETNALKLTELIERSRVLQTEKLREASARLQEQHAQQVGIAKRLRGDEDAPEKPKSGLDTFHERKERSVKVVITIGEDLATVEEALKRTGLPNRGDALLALCRNYLETHEKI